MLSLWCKRDGMLLITAKTKVVLITTSQKRFHLHDNVLNLTYNSDILKNVNNDKVLGVFMDNNPHAVYCKEIFFKFVASIKAERYLLL